MSLSHRARGVKVLKAVSSPVRLNILNLLFDKGALSYTELMNQLKMHPSRDAGRFAYHLKFLLKANLIEADSEAKKYFLTELGKMVIDIADRVDKKTLRSRGMIVRTSHSTVEEFDANKIANSLIREAKMPPDQAQKTAKETEKILQKSKTKYLTAPLIREIANAILIEKGLEEYRHKLTRLGMPVHEVAALIDSKETEGAADILHVAGMHTFSEYALLNVLPRDIADSHTTGALHISSIGTWLLRPTEILHDSRFFLQNGVKPTNRLPISIKPPKTFEAALTTLSNALLYSTSEINEMQTCDHFNTFLAPFIKGRDSTKAKEDLRLFLLTLNQHVNTTFGLDITIPKFLTDRPAISFEGKIDGNYGDFVEESNLLANLILDIYCEESIKKPLLNPKLILRVTKEDLINERMKTTVSKAHSLAAEKGILYFVNALADEENPSSFSSTGCKLESDLTGDWETDTMRTGCIGTVTINLPRILHESEKEPTKFFEMLKERYELATRALEIKQRILKQHAKNFLPFLIQSKAGDAYFRLENCSGIINFAGLEETIASFFPQSNSEEEGLTFAEEIVQNTVGFKQKIGRKHGKRRFPAIASTREASERLAQLDIEKYGVAKVKFSGTRDKPFYKTSKRLQLELGNPPVFKKESLGYIQKLDGWTKGSNLTIIELEQREYNPEDLLNITKQLVKIRTIELFNYNRKITYCSNCESSWIEAVNKCPSCGAVSTLVFFDKFGCA